MKSNSGENDFQYRHPVGSDGINTEGNNWANAVTIFDTLHFTRWYMIAYTVKNDTVKAYPDGMYIGERILEGPINPDGKPLITGKDFPGNIDVSMVKLMTSVFTAGH